MCPRFAPGIEAEKSASSPDPFISSINGPPSAIFLELIDAIRFGINKFEVYLGTSEFTVITDHKPLLHLTTQAKLSKRQIRILDDIAQYPYDTVYRRGPAMHCFCARGCCGDRATMVGRRGIQVGRVVLMTRIRAWSRTSRR